MARFFRSPRGRQQPEDACSQRQPPLEWRHGKLRCLGARGFDTPGVAALLRHLGQQLDQLSH